MKPQYTLWDFLKYSCKCILIFSQLIVLNIEKCNFQIKKNAQRRKKEKSSYIFLGPDKYALYRTKCSQIWN